MRLQLKTLGEDVKLGLIIALMGFPIGALFAMIYEVTPSNFRMWLFVLTFLAALLYTLTTEFVLQFVTSAVVGLMFGLGAALIVKNIVTLPVMLGFKLAGTYYIAFGLITWLRHKCGTLPI